MRVMVGMSGGVDSTVAAYLLKAAGHDVCGATLVLADEPDTSDQARSCCSPTEVASARAVASILGINHLTFDFSELFEREVKRRFADVYAHGGTPNPCVDCNRNVKFPALLERARELGYDCIATGHYACLGLDTAGERAVLRCGVDAAKDQSYMLYALSQDVLLHTLLPLGELRKDEVRAIARTAELPNAGKPDSEDICFVPDGDYAAFLEERGVFCGPGDIVDASGKVLGHHDGLIRYTIGQRRGVHSVTRCADQQPLYVIGKQPEDNRLVVGPRSALAAEGCVLTDLNWVSIGRPPLGSTLQVRARIRYRQKPVPAKVHVGTSDEDVTVAFDDPCAGIAPGQACVLYDDDVLLGGGTIARALTEGKRTCTPS